MKGIMKKGARSEENWKKFKYNEPYSEATKNFVGPPPVVRPKIIMSASGMMNNRTRVRLSLLILPNSFFISPPIYMVFL